MATYTVKKGDTLSAIAKKYGTTYQAIAKANGISDPNKIYAGQTLKIGSSGSSSTSANKAATTKATTTKTTTAKASTASTAAKNTGFSYADYKPSDAVTQAQELLNQQLAQKPGEYQSTWQDQLNETLQQILNREKFSYDLNADMLYQQYKDQFDTKGKMAMMDTMGQAQAMTGGYGNSYAQSVGQQTYQGYLQQLNDKIPELYQLALSQYQMEGDELKDRYGMMAQQEELDYGRYRDQLADWQTERDYLSGRYDSERDYDYGMYADGRDFSYSQYRDTIADQQWQKEFDEAKRQFDKQMAKSSSGGSSGGSSKSSGSSSGSSSTKKTTTTKKTETPKADTPKDDTPKTPTNYKELSQYLSSISGSSTKQDLSKDINSALAAGIINQNQAQQLLKAYAPKGYTK